MYIRSRTVDMTRACLLTSPVERALGNLSSTRLEDLLGSHGVVTFRWEGNILTIARRFGRIMRDPPSGRLIDHIRIRERVPRSWLSNSRKAGALTAHTDYPELATPPHYVLLRCVRDGLQKVRTFYADCRAAIDSELSDFPLFSEMWIHSNGVGRLVRRPICAVSREKRDFVIRFAENASRCVYGNTYAYDALVRCVGDAAIWSIVLGEYQCVIFDNWHGMHWRDAEEASRNLRVSERIVERVLIV